MPEAGGGGSFRNARPSGPDELVPGDLASRLAREIISYARRLNLAAGTHLSEHRLAREFKVSRTPIRLALQRLAGMDVVEYRDKRGYFLRSGASLENASSFSAQAAEDPLYYRIADDRLSGTLETRFTESELCRRYAVSRARLARLLARMVQEGWLDRLPGQGWEFQPILTSSSALAQSYDYRIQIEPAAVRYPGYEIDHAAFALLRAQQRAMAERDISGFTSLEIFKAGADFHETIVRCSGNAFFLAGIVRVNRLRRLMAYRLHGDRGRIGDEARDHLQLLDMIEDGDREGAALFLERHLMRTKLFKLRSGEDSR